MRKDLQEHEIGPVSGFPGGKVIPIQTAGTGTATLAFLIGESKEQVAAPMSEREFSRYWQYQTIDSSHLFTETGESLKVLYPGRPNDVQGADFRDAVIISGDETLAGNVEIHLRSGDWRSHGHHLDPKYNNVVLHVVRSHNTKTGTLLQNGTEIPVLELGRYLDESERTERPAGSEYISGLPCSGAGHRTGPAAILEAVDAAGAARFLDKVQSFQKESETAGAGEAFYLGIMTALGYSGNKGPFRDLAESLPLKTVESLRHGSSSGAEYLFNSQALLLGTAGFLSPEFNPALSRSGIDTRLSERLRLTWSLSGETPLIPRDRWQFCMIRPQNSPVVRLTAMTHLLHRYREPGLLEGLLALTERSVRSGNHREAEKGLVISIPETEKPDRSLTLLGKSRAAAMVINILLPFRYATRKTSVPDKRQIMDYYLNYPKPSANSLEKHMVMQFGLQEKDIKTAVRQQGLIYLYRELCTRGKCDVCPLSQFQAGQHVQGQVADLS